MPAIETTSGLTVVAPSYPTPLAETTEEKLLRRFGHAQVLETRAPQPKLVQNISLALFKVIQGIERRTHAIDRIQRFTMTHLEPGNPYHQWAINRVANSLKVSTGPLNFLLRADRNQSEERMLIHDIRTSLAAIIGSLELLAEDDEDRTDLIAEVARGTRCLLSLGTRKPDNWRGVDEYMNKICPIAIRTDGLETLSRTRLTPDQLCNIMNNAGLNSRGVKAKNLWALTIDKGPHVELIIVDDGPGFPHEPGVLNLLARGGFGVKGNGLPTINQLCKLAGGELRLSNHPDNQYGAVLTIELPKAEL